MEKQNEQGVWVEIPDNGSGHVVASTPLEARNMAINYVKRTGEMVRLNGMTIVPAGSFGKGRGGRLIYALVTIVLCLLVMFVRF
jgi:hypothetical protein